MNKLKSKKAIITILVVLVIVLVVLGGILITKKNNAKNSEKSYSTVQVKKPAPFTTTGKIKASRTQQITLPEGKVQQVLIENGAQVSEGQELVTTYSQAEQNNVDELNQEITQQQRKVDSSQRQLNSLTNSQTQKNTDQESSTDSQEQIAEAQDNYDDAQDTLSSLQTKLQKSQNKLNNNATAPFSGIAQISYGQTGKPRITIYSNSLEFQGNVSEYDYSHLKNGMSLKVTALASKKSNQTKINFVSKEPSSTSKANEAKYEFTTGPLKGKFMNGQTARASVKQKGLSIPTSSVRKNGVYVVNKNSRVSFQRITGKSENGYYQVDSGLHLKQKVITNPDQKLQDGNKVKTDD
ncbi:hypothetical protein GNF18_03485 [Ligilactobacillus pobuzihii]|uniref:efflux RND transporter periplasmic adaptor subunit n=1 Tax=Ligilactobacillus pobuzihii TaxID=449659 RepID=UPI0019D1CB54|nr:hypothetical protein [Ligilactobacillus pobuzihii]MBN7274226.1 hypothetical protein [Ligilactobacillus pobuzihii]